MLRASSVAQQGPDGSLQGQVAPEVLDASADADRFVVRRRTSPSSLTGLGRAEVDGAVSAKLHPTSSRNPITHLHSGSAGSIDSLNNYRRDLVSLPDAADQARWSGTRGFIEPGFCSGWYGAYRAKVNAVVDGHGESETGSCEDGLTAFL